MPQRSRIGKETRSLASLVHVLPMTVNRPHQFSRYCSCPSFVFQYVWQVFAHCLPLHCCGVLYASAFWRRKMIFVRTSSVSEGEGKCIFLWKFRVSMLCMLTIANTLVWARGVSRDLKRYISILKRQGFSSRAKLLGFDFAEDLFVYCILIKTVQ